MQKSSGQALLKSKAKLTRRKEHLLMLVPKHLGSGSATPLERVFEIIEGTVYYSGPKFQRERITGHNVKIVEGTIRLGRWYPSNDLRLEAVKFADSASPRFYSGPKLQRERLAGHKFGTTRSAESKVASQRYECKGIGHFDEECLAQRKQRGNTRNSPGKGNPNERNSQCNS